MIISRHTIEEHHAKEIKILFGVAGVGEMVMERWDLELF